ncbi:MAG: hypothetical protein IT562_01835 [Alphaproteobacteria bacterium]|nr:hypothetical protein [Alphaproteobacteria bacterium]
MIRGSTVGRAMTGALVVMMAAAPGLASVWVKDPQSGCATSNPFPNPNESIRWFGNCRDGKLDGRGTLVWYRDGAETERNEGSFKDGELDGYAVTKYPEGYVVHGQYSKGQRHGAFMTIRGSDYIRATYYNGGLVSQSRLSPEEVADWNRRGGPQLVANAPPPTEAPKVTLPAQAAAAASEPPITGRTAVASPSRQLPPAPKPATAPPAAPRPAPQVAAASPPAATPATLPPPAQQAASPQAGRNGFVLGTQVIEAITPEPGTVAATGYAATSPMLATASAAPSALAPAVAAPRLTAPAGAPPAAAAKPADPVPTHDPGGFYLAAPSLTSPPLPGSAGGKVKEAPQPANAPGGVATAPQPASRYQLSGQATAAPVLPGTAPTSGSIASPSLPGLPAVATAQVAALPQQAQGAQAPAATNGRRPPWMGVASPDPVILSGAAMPGATPPPASPTPMASAAPLAGPMQPYVPPVYAPPPADLSPTAASRQYLALREAAETAQQMSALPSYRAMQSAAPPPTPGAPPVGQAALSGAMNPSGSAEALFQQGYKLEMSGRFREAEQTYEQIILGLPNTQTAMLANERLNGIRRNTRDNGVRIADQRQAQPERQSAVVAVNEPRNLPRYAQPTGAPPQQLGDSGAGDAGGGMTANLTGLSVCSQRGLYDKESRWCGMVLADDGARLSVEIRDVVLPGFGNIGIGSSKCSGGTFINWFSKGSMVRVPRSCMELKG